MKGLVLCITGASGSIYAKRFLDWAIKLKIPTEVVVSENAKSVISYELDIPYKVFEREYTERGIKFHNSQNLFSPLASGSRLVKYKGVVVLPCSVSTLGAVANGCGRNLIHRICDVAIKENVPLVMAIREMPVNAIHLENMLKLQNLGVKAFVISPGFYNKPKTLEDIADFVVGKIFDLLRIEHNIYKRWGGKLKTSNLEHR
jgi:4-hydroxy-3-polyprenylbenzoate decarboxylase